MKTERESTDFGNYLYSRVQCMVIPITTDFTVTALLVNGKQLLAASREVIRCALLCASVCEKRLCSYRVTCHVSSLQLGYISELCT